MDCNITIIGAGVVGLAVASELADKKQTLYILEKNRSHGMEISSRNSEVIHTGIYYPPGSLKSKLCIEGRELLYETCEKHRIPFKRTGKIIIATTDAEMDEIGRLFENSKRSGVTTVSLLDRDRIREIEPNIRSAGGMLSPESGIISVHSLMNYYLHDAKAKGSEIVYNTTVSGIEQTGGGYKLSTLNSHGELFEFTTEKVVNAAGLHSDTVAAMLGQRYKLHYCKGDYFGISNVKKGMVQRLIYPVPEKNHVGLGVHLTMDLNGRMKLGPDTTYIERKEDYKVDKTKRDRFYESAVKFLPFLSKEDIQPDMSGIRPKLQGPGEGFRDFIIREDLPGFVNFIGIESPGLTAAPAIARHVKKIFAGCASVHI